MTDAEDLAFAQQLKAELLEKKKGTQPDFKGSIEVAAWKNTDKNGEEYFSLVIGSRVNLFRNKNKQ